MPDLPIEEQFLALERNEDLARSPDAIPVYQRIAKLPLNFAVRNSNVFEDAQSMRAAAFPMWYRIDPAGAREEALRLIASEHPLLTADSLFFLPKEKLPEFESLWGRALTAADDYPDEARLLDLMTRFGAGTQVGLVREKAEAKVGEWACAPQNAALGYLVKFDPAAAGPLVARAISERGPGKTACYRTTLQEIARYASDPLLEKAAIDELQDPDPEATLDAVTYLMGYGDASAKEPVLHRYLEWSETWKGRGDELERRDAGSMGNWQEIGLGRSLAQTLIAGQGWVADRKLIAQVQEQCAVKEICDQVKDLAGQVCEEPFGISVNDFGATQLSRVAWYDVKSMELLDAKIAQFPRPTKFVLMDTGQHDTAQQALEARVRALVAKNGMVLMPPPAPLQAAN